jgi:hypothetical protein
MTGLYKTMVIVSLILSLLLSGNWIWYNWPRYEIKEEIVEVKEGERKYFQRSSYVVCDKELRVNMGRITNYECLDALDEKEDCDEEKSGYCYIKTKVRVN